MSDQTEMSEEFRAHLSPGKDWKEIVAWVGDLPPLPHVASQALSLIEDPDTSAGKLSELLGQDTALMSRVLKIANSAMFARSREITTISQAVMIIGFKTLKGVIVAATLRQLNRKFGETEKMIWENSCATAVGAQHFSQMLKKSFGDEVFLLGLLHDLGKLVLVRQIPDDYEKIMQKVSQQQKFHEVEQEDFGFAHPLIGALVSKKWNFSMEICQAILHHHDPITEAPSTPAEWKLAVMQLADMCAHVAGFGHPEGYPDLREDALQLGELVGFDQEQMEKIFEEFREVVEEKGGGMLQQN